MEDFKEKLREQAQQIVQRGQDIRRQISHLASEVAQRAHHEAEGLIGLTQAILEGAARGARQAVPDQAESILRQVIDGLGDAFSSSAQAVKLTLEEARRSGDRFAQEDLKKIVQDFRSVGEMFLDTVDRALQAIYGQATQQTRNLRDHAGVTLKRAQAGMTTAMEAARQDLGQLSKDALQVGLVAGRLAAGTFFSEVGKRMERLGEKLNRPSEH